MVLRPAVDKLKWPALFPAVLLAAADAHLIAFVYIAAARLVYPYELEWVEGGLADEVLAILHGQAPHAAPSVQRVAFIYPALYVYLSAGAASLLGPGFLPLRLVSFAAAAATLALPAGLGAVCALGLLQFAQLAYNSLGQLPTAANRAAGAALVQRLAAVNGDIFLPQHGAVAGLAGQPAFAHLAAIEAVLTTGGPPAAALLADVRAALSQRRFAAVVVDGDDFQQRFPELTQNYQPAESLPLGAAFYSVAGPRTLPEMVYVPQTRKALTAKAAKTAKKSKSKFMVS